MGLEEKTTDGQESDETTPALAPIDNEGKRPPWLRPVCAIPRGPITDAPFESAQPRDIAHTDDTEQLLNGLIAECHFLMRAIALPTAIQVQDAETRDRFLGTAMSLASTGAKVGRTIAKLRGAGVITELRQRHMVEHVVTTPAPSQQIGAKT